MVGLRRFSKFLVAMTLLLIFAGGMVTSTGSGLAVPDWPHTYGQFMFSFPLSDMVGGIFYEHGHRLIASTVGLLMVIQALWIYKSENRRWVKILACVALIAVISQGILGGLTVLYFLPAPISVCHALLAQTFFLLTIFMAYSLSSTRQARVLENSSFSPLPRYFGAGALFVVFFQLFLGAVMRHTESGLAIPDFPTMGGLWWPDFSERMIGSIKSLRALLDLPDVHVFQIAIHLAHRGFALVVFIVVLSYTLRVMKMRKQPRIGRTAIFVMILLLTQIILGILTVLTVKRPLVASLHVVTGAALLGSVFLLVLQTAPLSWSSWTKGQST